eukprot:UN06446
MHCSHCPHCSQISRSPFSAHGAQLYSCRNRTRRTDVSSRQLNSKPIKSLGKEIGISVFELNWI